jgi:hypothetical protein
MAIGIVVLLIGAGTGISWAANSRAGNVPAASPAGLEAISGVLLIAGLALLGLSMPLVQRMTAG